ncbi:hypothetical protein M569_12704, partial [Genlisea aurea]
DKVHPSAKPPPPLANGAASASKPAFPPVKSQLYNARRPSYRPQPPPRRQIHRRGCLCRCCLWTTLLIFVLIVLAAIAGGVFYLIYRPHRPSISVNSIRLSTFNLTDTSVISSFNISVTARNPNSRIAFIYDQTTVRFLSKGIDLGDGSLPGFTQGTHNATTLATVVTSNNAAIGGTAVSELKSILKRKKNMPLEIRLYTKIRAKIGSVRTEKLGLRVICDGINIPIPSTKTPSSAAPSNTQCKVDPRIKIIRWALTL